MLRVSDQDTNISDALQARPFHCCAHVAFIYGTVIVSPNLDQRWRCSLSATTQSNLSVTQESAQNGYLNIRLQLALISK